MDNHTFLGGTSGVVLQSWHIQFIVNDQLTNSWFYYEFYYQVQQMVKREVWSWEHLHNKITNAHKETMRVMKSNSKI